MFSDIGGHFENNLLIQQMNLRAMIEFARGYGRAKFSFRGIEDDVARIISSPVSKAIALVDAENPAKSGQRWNDASVFEQWRPLTTDQYIAELKAIGSLGWASNWESEGSYGTQKGWLLGGVEAVVSRLFIDPPIRRFWDPPSPWSSHIARSFDWQNRELWDLSMSDSSGKKLVLTDLQKAQFRMLYLRKIDSYKGGWQK